MVLIKSAKIFFDTDVCPRKITVCWRRFLYATWSLKSGDCWVEFPGVDSLACIPFSISGFQVQLELESFSSNLIISIQIDRVPSQTAPSTRSGPAAPNTKKQDLDFVVPDHCPKVNTSLKYVFLHGVSKKRFIQSPCHERWKLSKLSRKVAQKSEFKHRVFLFI